MTANAVANVIRNVWANAVIFCGHFPDGAEKFTKTDMIGETKGQWYLRQMLGSANFEGGPLLRFMSGNLCHQIEHHLYPDLPSNRLHEISVRVRQVCDKYDLPYTTGSFLVQYGKTWRTIAKLSLPNKYLTDDADNAPETRSERMFAELEPGFAGSDPATGRRRGLKTAIATVRGWRRDKRAKRQMEGRAAPRDDLAAVFSSECTFGAANPSGRYLFSQGRQLGVEFLCGAEQFGIGLDHHQRRRLDVGQAAAALAFVDEQQLDGGEQAGGHVVAQHRDGDQRVTEDHA